jgi:hypothetical protein
VEALSSSDSPLGQSTAANQQRPTGLPQIRAITELASKSHLITRGSAPVDASWSPCGPPKATALTGPECPVRLVIRVRVAMSHNVIAVSLPATASTLRIERTLRSSHHFSPC